jgi:hypothetical protein
MLKKCKHFRCQAPFLSFFYALFYPFLTPEYAFLNIDKIYNKLLWYYFTKLFFASKSAKTFSFTEK